MNFMVLRKQLRGFGVQQIRAMGSRCWLLLAWLMLCGAMSIVGNWLLVRAEPEALRPWRSLLSGGLGSWLAHFAWLDSALIEPQQTPEQAVFRILEVCSWDPGNPFFVTQGAGILAFDLGIEAGRTAAEGYARDALKLLDAGRPWAGNANLAAIDFAYGKILSARLGDKDQALLYFQRAAGEVSSSSGAN